MPASGGAIEAGKAFVSLFVDDSRLLRGLSSASGKLKSFGTSIAAIGGGMMAAGAAILAPLALAVNSATDYGSSIKDAADRTGVAAEELQGLKHAAEQSGASFEDLEKAITIMQKKGLGEGAAGLKDWADKIAGLESASEQTAMAMEAFGKGGAKLLPLLKGGAAAIDDLAAESEKLGIVMSEEDVDAAEAFGDELANLQKMVFGAKVQIGSALIPVLREIVAPMIEASAAAVKFIRDNRGIVVGVAAVGAGLAAAGAAVTAVGGAFIAAGLVLAGVKVAIGGVAAAFGTLLSPIALVAVAVAGIGILWATQTESGKQSVNGMRDGFASFAETAKESWAGIVAAINKGDMQAAFAVVGASLRMEWAKVVAYWTDKWNEFRDKLDPKSKEFKLPAREWASEFGGFVTWAAIRPFNKDLADTIKADFRRDMKEIENPTAGRTADERGRDPGLLAAIAELEAAKAAYQAAIAVANAPGSARGGAFSRSNRSRIPGFDAMDDPQSALASASKSVLSGSILRGALATADKISEQIAKNTGETVAELKRLNDKLGNANGAEFEE